MFNSLSFIMATIELLPFAVRTTILGKKKSLRLKQEHELLRLKRDLKRK